VEYDDERGRRWIANIGIFLLIALVVAGGVWLFSSDDASTKQLDLSEAVSPPTASSAAVPSAAAPANMTTLTPTSTGSASTSTTSAPGGTVTTDAGGTDTDATSSTLVEPEVAQAGPTLPGEDGLPTLDATTTTAEGPGYPTNPDGTPLPIIAIFDIETVTLTGYVPSEAARERLGVLAAANSKTPATIVDNMIVNPNVPMSVGVRVIEMNSVRFPEGSADILPEHATELDRVVTIMNALPNITVLVIGHADQRGTDAANFAISDERARAVVNYLRFMGISPTRLSSRAAGASDLLTLDNDAASLALNRRTEFIFYGLIAE